VDSALSAGKHGVGATRDLIVVAGPNGSGKTTFAREFLEGESHQYLSADAIAEAISPDNPSKAQLEAGREFLVSLNMAMTTNRSLLIESTLSGRGLIRHLKAARAIGFRIRILKLFVDSPETCLERISERVRKGGHNVPEEDVRRRFDRSLRNFWYLYRILADEWTLTYNAVSQFEDVAIGTATDLAVRDDAQTHRFQELVTHKEK